MNKPALALLCGCLVGTLAVPAVAQDHPADPASPFSCAMPISQRTQEAGCYLLAAQNLSSLPSGPLFWHLYTYPTMEAAPKGDAMNTVVEAHGKVWLFRIAPADWKPSSGERVAVVGPLVLPPAKAYIARYLMNVTPAAPGRQTPAHRHPGTEAWYIIGGQQCMLTPGKAVILRAGESAFVPGGVPMVLEFSSNETLRSLVLILHDASFPQRILIDYWKPEVACPAS
jgi:quercetin dioxygenase-like cupin family protein